MKISGSIRQLYESQLEVNELLKNKVDERIKSLKSSHWHYESRIKNQESFALKIESGRYSNPSKLEDIFACTIVVRNGAEIEDAENFVLRNFDEKYRRPKKKGQTHKEPDSFPFDDLRLYVTWQDDPALPLTGLSEVIFELQIKTFLQHAWSVATHDLIYKTDTDNWSEKRIAFQIKAMLEHAEVSIQEASTLAKCDRLALSNTKTKKLEEIIKLLKSIWTSEELPKNVRGLAENINSLISEIKIEANELGSILDKERMRTGGSYPTNLSPYGVVVQALLNNPPYQIKNWLTGDKTRLKALIPSEISTPSDLRNDKCVNAIFIGEPSP